MKSGCLRCAFATASKAVCVHHEKVSFGDGMDYCWTQLLRQRTRQDLAAGTKIMTVSVRISTPTQHSSK